MLPEEKPGLTIIASGCALPVVTFIGALVAMMITAAIDPVPNQGAMLLAGLVFVSSIGIGILMIAIGALVLVRSGRNSSRE